MLWIHAYFFNKTIINFNWSLISLLIAMFFARHRHESATGAHVLPSLLMSHSYLGCKAGPRVHPPILLTPPVSLENAYLTWIRQFLITVMKGKNKMFQIL